MLTKVSVARVSYQVWGASTDQPEKVPAEKCSPAWRQTQRHSHPALPLWHQLLRCKSSKKELFWELDPALEMVRQPTIWGRRSRNGMGKGTCKSKSKL